jgi:hypothetical protein
MAARITKDEFLARAQQRFGDRFDYSGIHYRSYKSPIKIICRKHPVQPISITPEKHLPAGEARRVARARVESPVAESTDAGAEAREADQPGAGSGCVGSASRCGPSGSGRQHHRRIGVE